MTENRDAGALEPDRQHFFAPVVFQTTGSNLISLDELRIWHCPLAPPVFLRGGALGAFWHFLLKQLRAADPSFS